MGNWLVENYNLVRAIHVLAVIAWMAGMLYLPRLFAYHAEASIGSELDLTFQKMEERLLRIIINPSMFVAFGFGLALLYTRSQGVGWAIFAETWVVVKLAGVLVLSGFHGFLAAGRKAFVLGQNVRSSKFWRISNELPFVLAIFMVLAVTLEF